MISFHYLCLFFCHMPFCLFSHSHHTHTHTHTHTECVHVYTVTYFPVLLVHRLAAMSNEYIQCPRMVLVPFSTERNWEKSLFSQLGQRKYKLSTKYLLVPKSRQIQNDWDLSNRHRIQLQGSNLAQVEHQKK